MQERNREEERLKIKRPSMHHNILGHSIKKLVPEVGVEPT